jgi:hypothetical protein
MFENCLKLQEIKVAFTEWNSYATSSWVENVPSGGIFIKPSNLINQVNYYSIPDKWEIK